MLWGEGWRTLHAGFPLTYAQRVMRVPWFGTRRGKRVFRGWEWICPGRLIRVRRGDGPVRSDSDLRRPSHAAEAPAAVEDEAATLARLATSLGGIDLGHGCWELPAIDVDGEDDASAKRLRPTHPLAPSLKGGGSGSSNVERLRDHERLQRFLAMTAPPRARMAGESADVEYVHVPCGRRCHYLYGPMPVWTLASAMGFDEGLPLPMGCGLGASWRPGAEARQAGDGWRTFACKQCWQVRTLCHTTFRGWNDFVTLISGGLLCGRDVIRPEDEAPLEYQREGWERKRTWSDARPMAQGS
jgi:hypothetical protein